MPSLRLIPRIVHGGIGFGPKITLTREELYEKVWSTPVQKLAAEFGFSDRGLAKLCKRYQVPVPPRGYWARLQVGQTPTRAVLPVPKDPRLITVEIYPHERPPEQPAYIETTEIPTIHVAADLVVWDYLKARAEVFRDSQKLILYYCANHIFVSIRL